MLEIEGNNNDYSIKGYISLPEVYKSNRNGIITIVNGRIVKNAELNRTINELETERLVAAGKGNINRESILTQKRLEAEELRDQIKAIKEKITEENNGNC